MAPSSPSVRPTLRWMTDLGAPLPDIAKRLDEIDEPVMAVAQSIPERRDAGGAERVLALSDRVWSKVKAGDRRGTVTELREDDLPDWVSPLRGAWWIGAAGRRQGDSPQRDFYAVLERGCTTGRTVSSVHLLPGDKDWKRFALEQAYAWRIEMRRVVVRLIADSMNFGRPRTAEFRKHRITALVRADNRTRATSRSSPMGPPTRTCSRCSWTAFPVLRTMTGSPSPRRSLAWSHCPVRSSGRPCSRRRSRAEGWSLLRRVVPRRPEQGHRASIVSLALPVASVRRRPELLVGRNYALALLFITAMALLMSQLGTSQPTGDLLLDRGVESAIGAAAAIVLLVVEHRRASSGLLVREPKP
jgi:hypothetical protein